jgi:hypothetical protein
MELLKEHRQSLLNELEKAKYDLELQKLCLSKEISKERNNLSDKKSDLVEWFEIACFLAQERIKLIEKSLIENQIDY